MYGASIEVPTRVVEGWRHRESEEVNAMNRLLFSSCLLVILTLSHASLSWSQPTITAADPAVPEAESLAHMRTCRSKSQFAYIGATWSSLRDQLAMSRS